jgi:hypothetical protein
MEAQTTADTATTDTVAAAPVITEKKSRFAATAALLRKTPKWALITVPAVAIALAGYGYTQRNSQNDAGAGIVAMQAPVAGSQGAYYGEPMPQGSGPVAYGPAYAAPGAYYGP